MRLALCAAALAIAGVNGDATPVAREFLGTFSNEMLLVPICTALGFAYVLKHTGCERHLVLFLGKSLRFARWRLTPGVRETDPSIVVVSALAEGSRCALWAVFDISGAENRLGR